MPGTADRAGANVKVVQGMLGHSSASVTLDTYSHVFPALSEQLTQGMETDSLTGLET
ncbi:MAG: integrase [Actinomycetota bacterium]|nr:integrase [Actinomycetota bacterium]